MLSNDAKTKWVTKEKTWTPRLLQKNCYVYFFISFQFVFPRLLLSRTFAFPYYFLDIKLFLAWFQFLTSNFHLVFVAFRKEFDRNSEVVAAFTLFFFKFSFLLECLRHCLADPFPYLFCLYLIFYHFSF